MNDDNKVPPSPRLKNFISFENGIDQEMRRKLFPGADTYLRVIAEMALGGNLGTPSRSEETEVRP